MLKCPPDYQGENYISHHYKSGINEKSQMSSLEDKMSYFSSMQGVGDIQVYVLYRFELQVVRRILGVIGVA